MLYDVMSPQCCPKVRRAHAKAADLAGMQLGKTCCMSITDSWLRAT